MKTPYFLIHENSLAENVKDFKAALEKEWPFSQAAYSVKTNSLPWVLKYLRSLGLYAEVVSDEEYHLAKMCGYSDHEIIFNGPIKSKELLEESIRRGAAVNLDSAKDIETVLSMDIERADNIGIRINIDPDVFSSDDIDYSDSGFRFGFSEKDYCLAKIFKQFNDKFKGSSFGLHLHCNSITRGITVYQAIARYASYIIRKYRLTPSFIDIGGGFFGGVPGKTTPLEYIEAIKNELKGTIDLSRTKLIVEPGSAIIGSAVDLITSVTDIKDTSKARIVTTDGSRIHIDPLWAKSRYLYSVSSSSDSICHQQIICGYTCMDHDRIMVINDQKELRPGDTIIYHRVGAYSVTFGGMFIRYLPEVFVKHTDGTTERVRNPISVEDYYAIQS